MDIINQITEEYFKEINNKLDKLILEGLRLKGYKFFDRLELEFFIKGLTSKRWLQDRGCWIWNEWANTKKVPYGNDPETKEQMFLEDDLGAIYGKQWRNFGGVDQLERVVITLKTNPNDRRMIVSAWNPPELSFMALPPCHVMYQIIVINDTINLNWYQRSVDTMLGLPYNIASYGLLLELLAKESGLIPARLCGMLGDVHIYENHIENAKIQLWREPSKQRSIIWNANFNSSSVSGNLLIVFAIKVSMVSLMLYISTNSLAFSLLKISMVILLSLWFSMK